MVIRIVSTRIQRTWAAHNVTFKIINSCVFLMCGLFYCQIRLNESLIADYLDLIGDLDCRRVNALVVKDKHSGCVKNTLAVLV